MRNQRLATVLGILVLCSGSLQAAEPHQEWLTFLKGDWSYEYPTIGMKGEVKYSPAAKGHAAVARGTEKDDAWVEVIGWRPDKKMFVFSGYSSKNGSYWQSECAEISKEKVSGTITGILPDGRPGQGMVTLKRIDDNTFEAHLKIKTKSEEVADVGKFTRKQQ